MLERLFIDPTADASSLTSLALPHTEELTQLYIGDSSLQSVDVSHNPQLQELTISSDHLSSLDLSHNTQLTFLRIDSLKAPMTSLDLSHNTQLTKVLIYGTHLASLDVSKNRNLTLLEIAGSENENDSSFLTPIRSLDVSHNVKLDRLKIGSDRMSSLDVSHNVNLTDLDVSATPLTTLDVSHNTQLEKLHIQGTRLASVDVTHNKKLTTLLISGVDMDGVNPGESMRNDGENAATILAVKGWNQPLNEGNSYSVEGSSLDLKKLIPWFDVSKVSDIEGGKISPSGVISPIVSESDYSYALVSYKYAGILKAYVYFNIPEPVYHTVSFDARGGTPFEDQYVKDGDKAPQLEPYRWGYSFAGWYYGNAKWDFNRAVTSDITLVAHWTKNAEPVTYRTVAFNSNGGSAVTSQKVTNGGKVKQPANPTRSGYTFAGWYYGNAKWDFNRGVTANITLTAQWTKNPTPVVYRTVAFNSNGGSKVASQKVANGGKVKQPATPTRSGYTFAGWYYGNAKWDFNRGVTANITLTARWTKNAPSKPAVRQVPVYRVYNRRSGLHHYTTNKAEKNMLVRLGWRDESRKAASFITVSKDTPGARPVYREYNRRTGNHNWTLNKAEHDMLVRLGWKNEGVAWYAPSSGKNVYRLYNRNSGEHVYTMSYGEYVAVQRAGWRGEGVAWKSL
ncbi:InlB B-repeat-containing protein [Bifidobacterium simiarum]